MPFQPCPDIASFRLQIKNNGQLCENVFHVQRDTGWTETDLGDTCAAILDWTETKLFLWPDTVVIQRVVARDLTTEDGIGLEVSPGIADTGTLDSPELPNNVALAVKWTTGLVGRSRRGRTYHMGLTEIQVTGNTVDPSAVAALLDMYLDLKTAIESVSGNVMVVLSRWSHNVLRDEGIGTPILNVSVDNTIDSQRRRLPGRGS
jgi:hypothetical protein